MTCRAVRRGRVNHDRTRENTRVRAGFNQRHGDAGGVQRGDDRDVQRIGCGRVMIFIHVGHSDGNRLARLRRRIASSQRAGMIGSRYGVRWPGQGVDGCCSGRHGENK
ncbi:hypothetical protein SDC9_120820 [bioreactor metagenome]|uniref:Uncharacterized protein n=1 Tax=bioreactor metagenome TaxID=1076179 RepID=A0A645CA85_9ZZZZ